MRTRFDLDDETAQRMLYQGATVREVAVKLGVSTQAVYAAIMTGRLTKPSK